MTKREELTVEQLFDAALDLEPTARQAFLKQACRDPDKRREVEALLKADAESPPSVHQQVGRRTDDIALVPGTLVKRYKILRELGQGGMGVVFQARDQELSRLVALKFLRAYSPEKAQLFLREARVTAQCRHENIVVIHDVDVYENHPYMVLEHLSGQTLRERITKLQATQARDSALRTMPTGESLGLCIPIVRALACAHRHGIVHRDLKPENVFITEEGTIKVLDFGIAKALSGAASFASTVQKYVSEDPTARPNESAESGGEGFIIGTLPYMAPEQWVGKGIDHQADLWAMGIILYELVGGKHPLEPLSRRVLRQVEDLSQPMPSAHRLHDIPEQLATIIDLCLRKRKAERMPTAIELLAGLEAVQADLDRSERAALRTTGEAQPQRTWSDAHVQSKEAAYQEALPYLNRLETLLAELFSTVELRAWLLRLVGLEIEHSLPPTHAPFSRLAREGIMALHRRGLLNSTCFRALEKERPSRAAEIKYLECWWLAYPKHFRVSPCLRLEGEFLDELFDVRTPKECLCIELDALDMDCAHILDEETRHSETDGVYFDLSVYTNPLELLDVLYINYLQKRFQPLTYGREWILVSGSRRALVPWEWLCNYEDPEYRIPFEWMASVNMGDYGVAGGSRLSVIDLKRRRKQCHVYGIAMDSPEISQGIFAAGKMVGGIIGSGLIRSTKPEMVHEHEFAHVEVYVDPSMTGAFTRPEHGAYVQNRPLNDEDRERLRDPYAFIRKMARRDPGEDGR